MHSKNKLLYTDYFTTHFNTMYDGIFRDKYDTYDNSYNLCFKDYITGITYNRSKRIYVNWGKRYVLDTMYEKTRIEERFKINEVSYDIVLPFEFIKSSLPPILPAGITNIIYSFYKSLQPCVRELQDWFGENSDTMDYDDNQYEAQASLILEFVNIDKYS